MTARKTSGLLAEGVGAAAASAPTSHTTFEVDIGICSLVEAADGAYNSATCSTCFWPLLRVLVNVGRSPSSRGT